MLELALKMVLCLLIAAILGAIIGFLLGRISKCDEAPSSLKEEDLSDYAKKEQPIVQKAVSTPAASDTQKEERSQTPTESSKEQEEDERFSHIQGIRPISLDAPRNGKPDDLKEISGIGLKIEEALNELGIYHFDQIAAWTQDNIDWIDNFLAFRGRVNREDWVSQAKLLAAGGSTEFSRKVKKGEVERYKQNKG